MDRILVIVLSLPSLLAVSLVSAGLWAAGWLGRGRLLEVESRPRAAWSGWDVALYLALMLTGQVLAEAIARPGGPLIDEAASQCRTFAVRVSLVKAIDLAAAVALVAWFARRRIAPAEVGLSLRRLPYDVLIGAAAFLAVVGPLLLVQSLLGELVQGRHPFVEQLSQAKSVERPALLAAFAVSAVLLAPLTEEFFFRVLLQGWLEARERAWRRAAGWPAGRRGWLPILLSSAAFALLHLGHGLDAIPLFLFGLLLGYLYFATHRLWPSCAAHAALNALSMTALWLSGPG